MPTGLDAVLSEWQPFFSVAAGVAATLIGLLFVALALNPRIMTEQGPAGLRKLAGQTFHSFLMVLLLAMIAVLPGREASILAITLAIVGLTGLVALARSTWSVRTDPDPQWRLRRTVWRFLSPASAYLICLWAAELARRGDAEALGWMASVIFLLMMSAAASCWDLLRDLGAMPPAAPSDGTGTPT